MLSKLTPLETVKALCRNCLACDVLTKERLENCEGDSIGCVLFPYRFGKRISVKTLKRYCYHDCMACSSRENHVVDCTTEDCANYPYRFGTNPAKKGQGDASHFLINRS